MVHVIISPV